MTFVAGYTPVLLALPFIPSPFLRGFAAGASAAGLVGAVASFVVQATGTAGQLMGDLAEQWTASELRQLRRRGWKLMNHFALREFEDMDHVVVGPGGIFVVETKWSSNGWQLRPPSRAVAEAADQVAENARLLATWHGVKTVGRPAVHGLVVLWGPIQEDQRGVVSLDGVTVVHGRDIATWRAAIAQDVLSAQEVRDLWSALETHAIRRDGLPNERERVPASLFEMATRLLLLVAVGAGGFVASAQVLAVTHHLVTWVAATVALTGAGLVLRYLIDPLRFVGLAWATGCGATLLLAPVYVILSTG